MSWNVPVTADNQQLANLLQSALGRELQLEEVQLIGQGQGLSEGDLKAIVLSSVTGWQGVKDNYLVYPELMQTLVDYRERVIDSYLNALRHNGDNLSDLRVVLSNNSGLLPQPDIGIVAEGSRKRASDYDANFFTSRNKWKEIAGVEEFNARFRQDWKGRESGFVFDTNVYTSGHIRLPAFGPDSQKLRLVKQVRHLLKRSNNPPTSEHRQAVNDLVSKINPIQDSTIRQGLGPLEAGNFKLFSRRVEKLEEKLEKEVINQYQESRWHYGVGPDFDEAAIVMGLVHLREYWRSIPVEETDDSGTAAPLSGWDYLCQGLTQAQLSEASKRINQQRLKAAQTLHDRLCEERRAEMKRLQQRYPNQSETSLSFKSDNALYVRYLQQVELKLNEQQDAPPSAQPPLQLDLQNRQSIALFFANEAYITAAALEQVLLNQQMKLDIPISTQQYQAASLEHTAYVGEQIRNSNGSWGQALWRTAKYVDRFLQAVKTIAEKSGGQIPLAPLREQMDTLGPVVEELLTVKNDETLTTDDQKTQTADLIGQRHANRVGATLPELARQCLDRQIDLYLQSQAYLEQQHHRAEIILGIARGLFATAEAFQDERLQDLDAHQQSFSGQHYQLVQDSRLERFRVYDKGERGELICYSLPQGQLISADGLSLEDVSRWIAIHKRISRQPNPEQER